MSSIKEYFKEEGRKEGIEKGHKQGIERGKEQEKDQVALNMLKNGESEEKVALYTGLSLEKIELLQKRDDK